MANNDLSKDNPFPKDNAAEILRLRVDFLKAWVQLDDSLETSASNESSGQSAGSSYSEAKEVSQAI